MDQTKTLQLEPQTGERVGAVLSADKDTSTITLLGYGIFEGNKIPDPEVGIKLFGKPMTRPNPCILLDSGKRVYGCECWWGPESKIKDMVARYKNVSAADIDEVRKSL